MKSSPLPKISGVALVALSATGFSHWWSVNQFVSAVQGGIPLPIAAPAAPRDAPAVEPSAPDTGSLPFAMNDAKPALTGASSPSQKAFYEALVARMERLQNQNRDLLDQVAETNRDVMKLEFRVDTHSESFRPMPIPDDLYSATSFDDGPGVLPPRAEPVFLPGEE
jgi:hypothetical protein